MCIRDRGRTVVSIAGGKDPKQVLKEHTDAYQRDPESVLRDLRTLQRDFETIMAALTGRVRQTWGEKEIKVPEQKKYVKYTQNYICLLYTSPSPRDRTRSRMPSSA